MEELHLVAERIDFKSHDRPGLQLGAPGVYFEPVVPPPTRRPVHLDEAGFVGIAARGPVNKPVKVTSWSEFVRWYGGLPRPERGEPPTLLAHAVQTYFAQGGRTAWVVRVGPPDSVVPQRDSPRKVTIRFGWRRQTRARGETCSR